MTVTDHLDHSLETAKAAEWTGAEPHFAFAHGRAAARHNEGLRMVFYHRTTLEDAQRISIRGFEDVECGGRGDSPPEKGVWFADRPAEVDGGTIGDVVLRASIPEHLMLRYLRRQANGCRLFLVPTALANAHAPVQACDERGNPIDFCRAALDALRARYQRIGAGSPSATDDGAGVYSPKLAEFERQVQQYGFQIAQL